MSGRRIDQIFPETPDWFLDGFEETASLSRRPSFVVPDGADGWLELSLSRIDREEGVPFGCLLQVRDVTHRIQVEQTLMEEVSRRRLLVEQCRDGIVVLDREGRVDEANQEFAHMLGYSMEEMADLYVWDWDAVASKEQLLGMLDSIDTSGDHFETRHRRKDGSLCEVEISTNGAMFGGQKYIFCVCRDVTRRRQAEREKEQLIAELQEALAEVKALRGIVPICSYCHKVRDDEGFWEQVDVYIRRQSGASVSHGICPECMKQLFPELCELGD